MLLVMLLRPPCLSASHFAHVLLNSFWTLWYKYQITKATSSWDFKTCQPSRLLQISVCEHRVAWFVCSSHEHVKGFTWRGFPLEASAFLANRTWYWTSENTVEASCNRPYFVQRPSISWCQVRHIIIWCRRDVVNCTFLLFNLFFFY